MLESEYIVRPHEIGSKDGRSWFILVPVIVAREFQFKRNTVLSLRPDKNKGLRYLVEVAGNHHDICRW